MQDLRQLYACVALSNPRLRELLETIIRILGGHTDGVQALPEPSPMPSLLEKEGDPKRLSLAAIRSMGSSRRSLAQPDQDLDGKVKSRALNDFSLKKYEREKAQPLNPSEARLKQEIDQKLEKDYEERKQQALVGLEEKKKLQEEEERVKAEQEALEQEAHQQRKIEEMVSCF